MKCQIDQITIHLVRLSLKAPFTTSFGTVSDRDQILIEVSGGGISGWGESAVLPMPFYNPETTGTALHILSEFAIPIFWATRPVSPEALAVALRKIIGNHIGRSGLEMAYWDWHAKAAGQPLYRYLGGARSAIEVGVSLGITDRPEQLYDQVGGFLERGYKKIKVKIAPGFDLQVVEEILQRYPNCPLMVDANSAYTRADIPLFKKMDRFNLMMIEQPFRDDDLLEHAELQGAIRNPVCLDESVKHIHDAHAAAHLKSCRIINIKPGRVGGIHETKLIHDFGQSVGIGVWCGGMLETGVGRATNMAIATLPNFIYPGDISESARHYHDDIVDPPIVLNKDGTLSLSEAPGIGVQVTPEKLQRYTVKTLTYRAPA
jgi:O-succinylbenzoate synthase